MPCLSPSPGLFLEQPPEVFERQMRVNYLGTVHTIQAALPGMLRRRAGRVVLVTSGLAIVGFAGGWRVGVGCERGLRRGRGLGWGGGGVGGGCGKREGGRQC